MSLRLTAPEWVLDRLHVLPSPVMDAFGAVVFGFALPVAVRRGFFEALEVRPLTVEEIARETGFDTGSARLLADAFAAAGYLNYRRKRYGLNGAARKWLVKSSTTYLGNLIAYFETLHSRLAELEFSVDHGKPRQPYYASFSEGDWKTYAEGMADLARLIIPSVIGKLVLPRGSGQLLDIGCSHGLYAMECCRRSPGLRAVLMDFDPPLRLAEARAQEAGLETRIRFLGGDFLTVPFPPGQDVVLMFNIIHGFDEITNRTLVERAAESLRPGGRLYVLDQMLDVTQRSGLARFIPLMVGLNLLNEIGGRVYSPGDVREWCPGTARFRTMRLRFPGVMLVEATKK